VIPLRFPKGHSRIHLFNPLKHDWRCTRRRAHRSKAAWSWQRRAKLEARAIPNDFVALHYAHPPCVCVCVCVSLFSISHSPITQIVLHPPTRPRIGIIYAPTQPAVFLCYRTKPTRLLVWSVHPPSQRLQQVGEQSPLCVFSKCELARAAALIFDSISSRNRAYATQYI
jgi:hypothetical protein